MCLVILIVIVVCVGSRLLVSVAPRWYWCIFKREYIPYHELSETDRHMSIKYFSVGVSIFQIIVIFIGLVTLLKLFGLPTHMIEYFGRVCTWIIVGLILLRTRDCFDGLDHRFYTHFKKGEIIEIDDTKGTVVATNLKTTVLRLEDRSLFIINNSEIKRLINHSRAHYNAIQHKFRINTFMFDCKKTQTAILAVKCCHTICLFIITI